MAADWASARAWNLAATPRPLPMSWIMSRPRKGSELYIEPPGLPCAVAHIRIARPHGAPTAGGKVAVHRHVLLGGLTDLIEVILAPCLLCRFVNAADRMGRSSIIKMPMMLMTTSNSTRVKARFFPGETPTPGMPPPMRKDQPPQPGGGDPDLDPRPHYIRSFPLLSIGKKRGRRGPEGMQRCGRTVFVPACGGSLKRWPEGVDVHVGHFPGPLGSVVRSVDRIVFVGRRPRHGKGAIGAVSEDLPDHAGWRWFASR